MSQKNDSESAIWDYKPTVKKKKKHALSSVAKRRKESSSNSSAKATSDDAIADENKGDSTILTSDQQTTDANNETKEEFCPICQMPFSILLVQSQRWHVAECLDIPRDTCKECPDGPLCSSSIPNHYKKFNHTVLAHARANSDAGIFETGLDSNSQDSFGGGTPPSKPTNGLFLLRSPGPEDMKKKKGWLSSPSSKGPSSVSSSQESRTELSLTLAKNEPSLDSNDEISYSPLSELPAEMDTVNGEAHSGSEDEDSVVLFSDDDPLVDLESTSTVNDTQSAKEETLQSPQRLVLERLRETILSSSSVPPSSQAFQSTMAPSKAGQGSSFKQTDIGVFFGLKPLKEKKKPEALLKSDLDATCISTITQTHRGQKAGRHRKRNTSEDVNNGDVVDTPIEVGRSRTNDRRKRWWNREKDGGDGQPLRCPLYKKIPGSTFAIDAFRYGAIEGITAYFLTHFHSDHYGGLTKNSTLPIYCNKITGNLVKSKLRVAEQHVHILPMNTRVTVEGAQVILLDANHCPGAAMLLFFLPDGQTILHTGDFRADPSMEAYPELLSCRVQTLYLDTTYCSPEYTFPKQQDAVSFAASTAFELVTLHPRTLVVCGSYSVGKEKVFLALAEVLGSKVCLSRDKFNTMCCLESEDIKKCLTTDWKTAGVHVLPMMQLNVRKLHEHLARFSSQYDRLVAFKPTGWTFSQQMGSVEDLQPVVSGSISIYGIPYSEHSSFSELKRFVQWLRPLKIIPTVNNGSWAARKAMDKHFSQWLSKLI
ncbi:DNA cross-link repair 1A protein [Dunckerocampus dactyliophorus]|uniref:DNA cross-link repair 1A protein n=1 Tax=Dunckerocampus dactyliophorus TaxID=161453 RepID=UPI002405877B|nr:DNA cross-link repair 1A protein [Dunckerocampus dactyliophorus]